ncbi:MAG: class I SAM-dependent methyltransferase, partial [Cyanobacteria bacterium P01_F01_bin.3]
MTQSTALIRSLQDKATVLDAITGSFYSCHQEFYRSDRVLVDHQAARAFSEIVTDFPKLKDLQLCQRVSQLTSAIRSRWFDQIVSDFLAQSSNAVVVNLRSRLCTRYWRLPTLHNHWYEVDNADIMELRQRYFTIVPRDFDIACDCMDFSWIPKVQRSEGQPLLILLEGVCMYLKPEENQALFQAIAQHFGQVHLIFDSVSPRFIADADQEVLNQSENFLGERSSLFHWGMSSLSEMQSWSIQTQLIQ